MNHICNAELWHKLRRKEGWKEVKKRRKAKRRHFRDVKEIHSVVYGKWKWFHKERETYDSYRGLFNLTYSRSFYKASIIGYRTQVGYILGWGVNMRLEAGWESTSVVFFWLSISLAMAAEVPGGECVMCFVGKQQTLILVSWRLPCWSRIPDWLRNSAPSLSSPRFYFPDSEHSLPWLFVYIENLNVLEQNIVVSTQSLPALAAAFSFLSPWKMNHNTHNYINNNSHDDD